MTKNDNLPTEKRPIGFWIKAADRALDEAGDAIHAANGFTRRRWQVLSLMAQIGPISQNDLADELGPMMASAAVLAEVVALRDRGLVVETTEGLALTEDGVAMHRRLAAAQAEMRQKAMAGIDPADYAAAIRCLWGIARNLSRG